MNAGEAPAVERRAFVYTDGACLGSGGGTPGGYAALILIDGTERVVTGGAPSTTNTAMELTAIICALEALPPGLPATIHTDSRSAITGITELLPWWRSRRWRTIKGGRVANRDLWQRLEALVGERPVTWIWLKGHAGDALNERADALAYAEARRAAERAALL